MTFQTACMVVAGVAYTGASIGYFWDGRVALGICMALYAGSCVALLVEGAK